MNRATALEIVKEQLTGERYTHTLGVTETAVELAKLYGADVQKAEIAAIFHDYAKFRSKSEMLDIIEEQKVSKEFPRYGDALLHAPAGAFLVEKEAGIKDKEILSAIYWHTTGQARMTLLEKIIFIADYIEPNRSFPGVEEVRKEAYHNLDSAIIMSLRNTIQFLLQKGQPVFPETLAAYNELVLEKK